MFGYMQSAEDTADDIAKLYQKASGYISHELDKIFERYKRKHHLTDAEAYRLLNDLKDKTSLDELRQALRAPGRGQTTADILAELESPAFRARLERLQQLQNQIDLTMQQIYRQEKVRNTSHYEDLANEAYYRSIFDIQQRTGLGFSFSTIDHKAIDRVINSKWSGANYSERIWHNTRALAQDLKQELLINLVTGRTDSEVADIIANKYAQGPATPAGWCGRNPATWQIRWRCSLMMSAGLRHIYMWQHWISGHPPYAGNWMVNGSRCQSSSLDSIAHLCIHGAGPQQSAISAMRSYPRCSAGRGTQSLAGQKQYPPA